MLKEVKCPICNRMSNKYGWIAYCKVFENGYERHTIDYCCQECINHVEITVNQLQATWKAKVESIGIIDRKG